MEYRSLDEWGYYDHEVSSNGEVRHTPSQYPLSHFKKHEKTYVKIKHKAYRESLKGRVLEIPVKELVSLVFARPWKDPAAPEKEIKVIPPKGIKLTTEGAPHLILTFDGKVWSTKLNAYRIIHGNHLMLSKGKKINLKQLTAKYFPCML